MGTERIPERYQHVCDCCGTTEESPAIDRPRGWTRMYWERYLLDIQGSPVGDGTVRRLFCGACSTKIEDTINAAVAKP